MSVFFERFTLFCVIAVITALSLIIVTSVQLAHEPEIVINRENGNLLDSLKSVRYAEGKPEAVLGSSGEKCPPSDRARLLVVVKSPKRNRKVRQMIRRTWAHPSNLGVQVKFALTRSPEEQASFIRRHLKHFSRRCVPADYLLITSDLFFINTPQITAAINQQLPRSSTIICAKADLRHHQQIEPKFLTECDPEAPVLITRDVVTAAPASEAIIKPYFGAHLYLSPVETGKIVNGTIDGTDLLFFFSAQVADGARSINRLWMVTRDYRAIEA